MQRILTSIYGKAAVVATTLSSSLAIAGTAPPNAGATVTFGTPGAAGAAATAVPTLSNSLLIALGLILLVIALRVLKQNAALRKPLAMLLLGTGVAATGLGVERTLATSVVFIAAENDICLGGQTTEDMSGVDGGNRGSLANFCAEQVIEIFAYNLPCDPGTWIISNGDVGTKIQPSTEVELNRCPGGVN